jgi:16S rRNA G966 N2-methylase RsmD
MLINFLNKSLKSFNRYGFSHTLNYFFSKVRIRTRFNDSIQKKKIYLSKRLHNELNGEVVDGVFKGAKFIYSSSYNTVKPAQLLGCYEKEVQEKIFELSKKNNLEYFINIGAGDGYHAIGAKVANLVKNLFFFEMDEKNRNTIYKNLELNKCSKDSEILSLADLNFLKLIEDKIKFDKSLFLIDIEGDEFNILNDNNLADMKNSFLIIEFHSFYASLNVQEKFLKRLNKYFKVTSVKTGNRQFSSFDFLHKFNDDEKWLMMSECRPVTMEWLICEPKVLS